MPAIQPARLKQQAALLAEYFDNPTAFVRSLHHLLEFYADRAHRPGRSGEPPPLIDSYKIRPPVLHYLLVELIPLASQDPASGFALCDVLWGQPNHEFRLLAAMLLGQIPFDDPGAIIQRVQKWQNEGPDEKLLDTILVQGLEKLRQQDPQTVIRLAENWLKDPNTNHQKSGVHALLPLVKDPNFQNLPVFFRLLQPLTCITPAKLRPDLLKSIKALAHRTPQETAYFLRQNLQLPNCTDTSWLIRQSLEAFPLEFQQSLRNAIRNRRLQPASVNHEA